MVREETVYVIARDEQDFDDHAYPTSVEPQYKGFDFVRIMDPIAILERKPAIIHITKNAKQWGGYKSCLMNIGLLDFEPAVHEFKHDVPKQLTPAGIEEWLAE